MTRNKNRDDFKESVKRILRERVSGHCSHPDCDAPTVAGKAGDPNKSYSTGRAAHICAAAPGGARYDPSMTPEERSSIKNAIWLCSHHANEIDLDEVRFPATLLHEWKVAAERRVRERINQPQARSRAREFTENEQQGDTTAELKRLRELVETFISGVPQAGDRATSIKSANAIPTSTISGDSAGTESNKHVARNLDRVRAYLLVADTKPAQDLLSDLGDPYEFEDSYSRFRWFTNQASLYLINGNRDKAIPLYHRAYEQEPHNEKAIANQVLALFLEEKFDEAADQAERGLKKHIDSTLIWTHYLLVRFKKEPEKYLDGLPVSISEHSEILFSQAQIASWRNQFPEAVRLLDKCRQADQKAPTLSVNRCYLSNALSWASEDPYLCLNGQITPAQRDGLTNAIQLLEPLEQTLDQLTVDHIHEEVTNNSVYALLILGQKDRAFSIANNALRRHPNSDGLLRVRIQQLSEKDEIAAIKSLTYTRLSQLNQHVLSILMDIAANSGDQTWFDDLLPHIQRFNLTDQKQRDLVVLRFGLRWNIQLSTDLISEARKALEQDSENLMLRGLIAHMLESTGQHPEAVAVTREGLQTQWRKQPTNVQAHFANMLGLLKQYDGAIQIYKCLLKQFGNDDLTFKYLTMLLEGHQRQTFLDCYNQLPETTKQLPHFRHLLIDYQFDLGDWQAVIDLCEQREDRETDITLTLRYVVALNCKGDKNGLTQFLNKDFDFYRTNPAQEFEIAKWQLMVGHAELALLRVYRLFKANPTDTRCAGYFLLLAFRCELTSIDPTKAIDVGMTVLLQSNTEIRRIVLDPDERLQSSPWVEFASSSSGIVKQLMGLAVGETIEISTAFDVHHTIVETEHWSVIVAEKAHHLIANSMDNAGPVRSFTVISTDGTAHFDPLVRMSRERNLFVENTFELYVQKRLPLSFLSQLLKTSLDTIIQEWPHHNYPLFVNIGTGHAEDVSNYILNSNQYQYVLDFTALYELARLGLLDCVLPCMGKPKLAPSILTYIDSCLHELTGPLPAGRTIEVDGNLVFVEATEQEFRERESLLTEMKNAIERWCQIQVPVGPAHVPQPLFQLRQIVDKSTFDTLFLALEAGNILVTLDLHLRAVLVDIQEIRIIEFQSLLRFAVEHNALPGTKYTQALIKQVSNGYRFIGIRSVDLISLAAQDTISVQGDVGKLLSTFHDPTLNIQSAIKVGLEFIFFTTVTLPDAICGAYLKMVMDSLVFGRGHMKDEIYRKIRSAISEGLKYRAKMLRHIIGSA